MLGTWLTLGTLWVLLLPGVALCRTADRSLPWWRTLSLGLCLGLALAVARAMLYQRLGWLDERALLWGIEGSLAVASLLVLWLASRGTRAGLGLDGRQVLGFACVLLGSSWLRMIPHRLRPEALQVPDAPQHCTMATALLLTQGRASWEPFMDAPLRYPWGSQTLVAEIHVLTGVPLWGVFSVLLTAGLGLVSSAALAAVAAEVWNDVRYALGSAYVYAFLSVADGALFSRWGGLPTELCFCLGLGMAAVMLRGGRLALLMPLFVAGIGLCNVLLTLILGWVFALALAAAAWAFREQRTRYLGALAGAILGALPAVPVWLQVISFDAMGDTIAFQLRRHMDLYDMGHTHIGAYIVLLAALGLFAKRKPTRLGQLSLLAAVAALLSAFTLVFTLYKLGTWLTGNPRAVLVPSRWGTALTYPLSIYAGAGMVALWERLGGLKLVVAMSLAMSPIYSLWRLSFQRVDARAFEAFAWVRERAQPNDVIVSMVPRNDAWANAVTRLEANDVATPPGSDPLTRRAKANKRLRPIVKADGDLPRELAGDPPRRYFVVVDRRYHRLRPSKRREPLHRVGHISIQEWFPRRPR